MVKEDIAKHIQSVIKQNGHTVNEALVNSKAGKDLIANMKKGQIPNVEKIVLLAEYLDVSVDCLLGRENNSHLRLSNKKEECAKMTLNRKAKVFLYDALLSIANSYELDDVQKQLLDDLIDMKMSTDELKKLCATCNEETGTNNINIDDLFGWLNIYGSAMTIDLGGLLKYKANESSIKDGNGA